MSGSPPANLPTKGSRKVQIRRTSASATSVTSAPATTAILSAYFRMSPPWRTTLPRGRGSHEGILRGAITLRRTSEHRQEDFASTRNAQPILRVTKKVEVPHCRNFNGRLHRLVRPVRSRQFDSYGSNCDRRGSDRAECGQSQPCYSTVQSARRNAKRGIVMPSTCTVERGTRPLRSGSVHQPIDPIGPG